MSFFSFLLFCPELGRPALLSTNRQVLVILVGPPQEASIAMPLRLVGNDDEVQKKRGKSMKVRHSAEAVGDDSREPWA